MRENLLLSQMEVTLAERQFETKIVPLTTIGITQGTGTQQLGLEFRKKMATGTSLSYGMVGNRLEAYGSNYLIDNPTQARAYVRLSQGLFRRWGTEYVLTDLNVSELRAKQTEIETERMRQTLIQNTVRSHYELVLARQLLSSTEMALRRSQEHFASAAARQAIGLAAKADLFRAELAMLEVEGTVQGRIRQVRQAEDSYRELLGMAGDEEVVLLAEIAKMTPTIPTSWEEQLFTARLDWLALQVRQQLQRLELDRANRDLLPDIGLSVSLEQMGAGDTVEEALELERTNWSIQLEMLSSLDRVQEENVLLKKKLEAARLRRGEQALRRKIDKEVRVAFDDLQLEDRNHQLSLKRRQQAEMALDLAKTRYEKGLSNNLDVLDAESAYSEAEGHIARSLTAFNLAAIALAHNLGILDRQWVSLALTPVAAGELPGDPEEAP
jgi:outer membrane protein